MHDIVEYVLLLAVNISSSHEIQEGCHLQICFYEMWYSVVVHR
jgi:hypothetical protein